jgi:hypothetical protein
MSATSGLSLNQVARDSLLRTRRDFFFAPTAAADAALVASVDPNGVAVGGTFTILTLSNALMLRRARRVTMTINDDDAGGGLSLTVRVTGQRWGQQVSEILTATSTNTNDTTVTSVNVYDEVTEVKLLAKTADAGDDVTFGLDGTSFGLDFPIDNLADVQLLINTSTNTEAAATAVSTTTVQVGAATGGVYHGGHYIKGITLAATDRWEVRYLASVTQDGTGAQGTFR